MRTLGKFVVLLSLSSALAYAAPDPGMMAKLQSLYPKTKFSQVNSTVIPGVTEVVMGKNIAYVEDSGRYFLFGRLYDMQGQQDMTQARLEEVQPPQERIDASKIDTSLAVKIVHGNGERALYVFSDPECPYCKQLEKQLTGLNNVSIYVFMMPLESIHPKSRALATSIWCSKDKAKAWADVVNEGKDIPVAKCDTSIDAVLQLANGLGINGTPTLLTPDGRKLVGARDPATLDKWLNDGKTVVQAAIKAKE
jgi:thiol:disulfide interchange protein DsbC